MRSEPVFCFLRNEVSLVFFTWHGCGLTAMALCLRSSWCSLTSLALLWLPQVSLAA